MLPGMRKTLPLFIVALVLVLASYGLHTQGRPWFCTCGYVLPWSGSPSSSDTSQHLFDPYSFTHVLHGFVFFGLVAPLAAFLALPWKLSVALALEGLWEIVENSDFVIGRYRDGTAALGYEGDAIINSLGDMAACGLGFMLAYYLGGRRTLALFVAMEVVLALWIRDGLLLNVLMLAYPIDAVRAWQMGL